MPCTPRVLLARLSLYKSEMESKMMSAYAPAEASGGGAGMCRETHREKQVLYSCRGLPAAYSRAKRSAAIAHPVVGLELLAARRLPAPPAPLHGVPPPVRRRPLRRGRRGGCGPIVVLEVPAEQTAADDHHSISQLCTNCRRRAGRCVCREVDLAEHDMEMLLLRDMLLRAKRDISQPPHKSLLAGKLTYSGSTSVHQRKLGAPQSGLTRRYANARHNSGQLRAV